MKGKYKAKKVGKGEDAITIVATVLAVSTVIVISFWIATPLIFLLYLVLC